MKSFTPDDVINYYDQTEVHYRMFWNLEESMGLHYGVWDKKTKNTKEAIQNTNFRLMKLGGIKPADYVLDCGCGIGGSSIYLAKKLGCRVTGITLSDKQVTTATKLAAREKVDSLVSFQAENYQNTNFKDDTFDIVWAMESFGTSPDKSVFLKEMYRILKPNGKILFADTFKPKSYPVENEPDMQMMLNGWAISDILSIEELEKLSNESGFDVTQINDVTREVRKSVDRMFFAGILGMIGTKVYNFFRKATYFSRIHYKTGIAQKKAYKKGKWGYYLVVCETRKKE